MWETWKMATTIGIWMIGIACVFVYRQLNPDSWVWYLIYNLIIALLFTAFAVYDYLLCCG